MGVARLSGPDVWRDHRAAFGLLFASSVGLFLFVFVAAATTPWLYGAAAACWLVSLRARQAILGVGATRRALDRSGLLLLAACVAGSFATAMLLVPVVARLVP